MSQENVKIVGSIFEPFDGINIAAIDWNAEAIREAAGRAYSPDVELRTLASGLGSGVGRWSGVEVEGKGVAAISTSKGGGASPAE